MGWATSGGAVAIGAEPEPSTAVDGDWELVDEHKPDADMEWVEISAHDTVAATSEPAVRTGGERAPESQRLGTLGAEERYQQVRAVRLCAHAPRGRNSHLPWSFVRP